MKKKNNKTSTIAYDLYDRCICCGVQVPEGMMVCPNCESQPVLEKKDVTNKNQ